MNCRLKFLYQTGGLDTLKFKKRGKAVANLEYTYFFFFEIVNSWLRIFLIGIEKKEWKLLLILNVFF